MPGYQLAQLNIARMLEPLDSPRMAGFVQNIERINALAEAQPGFIWRLQDEGGDATSFRPFGEDIVVNLSVWEDVAALRGFVFQTAHVEIMRRRGEWFDAMGEAHMALWWVPAGHRPDLAEAAERLARLRREGPGPDVFTWRSVPPPPA